VERFTAILIEHLAGKWPFWLSPRQIAIVPVGADQFAYGAEVQAVMRNEVFLSRSPLPIGHLLTCSLALRCHRALAAALQARSSSEMQVCEI
jgi:hypothetical protein